MIAKITGIAGSASTVKLEVQSLVKQLRHHPNQLDVDKLTKQLEKLNFALEELRTKMPL